jgi:cytochrome c-type biogenesis protein CcmH
MIELWIAAAIFSALASTLIILRAARAASAAAQPREDPALAVYRRQLSEIDDLAERGLIPEDEHRSAHAEAARRLLSAADQTRPGHPAPTGAVPRGIRWTVIAVGAIAPLAAVALYLKIGSPGLPDQPFAARLDAWRKADLSSLAPQQLAALLETAVAKNPDDPAPLYYLARAQAESGDLASAEHNLRKAIQLAPGRAALWSLLGTVLSSQPNGEGAPEAIKAFQQAHSLDPADPDARYFLARAKIASGDIDGGLTDWKALSGDLKPDDPRKPVLDQEIAVVDKTHALPAPAEQPGAGPDAGGSSGAPGGQQAFIKAMVDRLATRLQTQPDDPAGWARLIRAYAVLGDQPRETAAMARAQSLFKDRPADLKTIQSAAGAPQGSVQ